MLAKEENTKSFNTEILNKGMWYARPFYVKVVEECKNSQQIISSNKWNEDTQ